MPDFTFLHAADIHLDSPLTGLARYEGVPAEAVRRAPRAAFDRLIQTAIDRQVDFMVIAGDLYDGDWKDMRTGLYFASAMGRLARAGIQVFLLAGNHDAASVLTRELPSLEAVRTFSTRRAETHHLSHLNVAIHGRSFADRAVIENLAAGYPAAVAGAFNIGVLHTSLSGHAAHETYAPCTPAELAARGYHYWALGHVHEQQIVSTRPHIVFPGNLQGRHIREDGPRGAMLVHVRDGEVDRLERLELDVVRWLRVDVDATGAADQDTLHHLVKSALQAASRAEPEDRALVVRLTLAGETTLHAALQDDGKLRDDVRGIAAELSPSLWIERVRVRTAAPAETAQVGTDEGALLIPAADAALATALEADFRRFFDSLPDNAQTALLLGARGGDWTEAMQLAGTALRHRLGNSG